MKKFFCFALAIMMLSAFAACSNSSDGPAANGDNDVFADGDQYDEIGGELNILNWGEYIDPELITLFEEETGVKVNYVEMTSNEEMLIKLKSSDCVYDMCFPSEYIIEQLIASDLLLPLDMDKIPNAKNIMADKLEITNSFDPGNKYSLPYMWGTVGILYNTTMVEEPVTSWGILWDEKYAGQIWMYDSVRDSIGITLKYLGSRKARYESTSLIASLLQESFVIHQRLHQALEVLIGIDFETATRLQQAQSFLELLIVRTEDNRHIPYSSFQRIMNADTKSAADISHISIVVHTAQQAEAINNQHISLGSFFRSSLSIAYHLLIL